MPAAFLLHALHNETALPLPFSDSSFKHQSDLTTHPHQSLPTSCIHLNTLVCWQSCTFDSKWESCDLHNPVFYRIMFPWKHLQPVNSFFLVVSVFLYKISMCSQEYCSWSNRQQSLTGEYKLTFTFRLLAQIPKTEVCDVCWKILIHFEQCDAKIYHKVYLMLC